MQLLKYAAAVLATVALLMGVAAYIEKPKSTYRDKPKERNPFEGKKVRFVRDENDPVNADGQPGHLEEIEISQPRAYRAGIPYQRRIKRLLDIICSFLGMVALSPILLIICIAIYIDDPGPVLFTQKRIGKNKEYFVLHKFRSMKMATPHDVPTHMLENPDAYITRVGKLLRSMSLDELPQLWDVFLGNMSLVGPRPALWNQDVLVAERDLYGANDVLPGLTGWAQNNGRDELEISEKARFDGDYCSNITFKMDVTCILMTVANVIKRKGVIEGGTGAFEKALEQRNKEIARKKRRFRRRKR